MSNNTFYPYAPYQQYQAAAGATPYPQLYSGQESYAGVAAQAQAYHQAWYNYAYQQAQHQQARQMAPVPTAPPMQTVMSSTPTPVPKTSSPAPATTNPAPATTAPPAPAPKSTAQSTFSSYTPSQSRSDAGHSFSHQFQSSMGTAGQSLGSRASRKSQMRGIFSKELPKLMYGFGDDKQVANDSVAVMEEILIEYIVDICQVALQQSPKKARLQIEDLRRALAHDPKKLARMEELLFMQEDIKRARKQFEDGEGNGGY